MNFQTPDYAEKLRDESGRASGCLGFGRIKFGGVLFAGALAETFLERVPGGAGTSIRASLNPALAPLAARSPTEAMAMCVVRTQPDLVATLLASKPAEQSEATALGNLAPALRPCLQAGVSVRLTGSAIRALTALAAWRLSDRNLEAAR